MTTSATGIPDVKTWGVEFQGATLHIDSDVVPRGDILFLDVETDERDNFVGIALTTDGTQVYYYTEFRQDVRDAIAQSITCGHNIKADLKWLINWGVPHNVVTNAKYDTALMSYVLDSTRESHGLKDLAKTELQMFYPSYKEMVGKGKTKVTLDQQPVETVANYCGNDVLATFRLYHYLNAKLSDVQKKYLDTIEVPTMWSLCDMERRGVLVNADYVTDLDTRFNLESMLHSERIKRVCRSEINLNSPKQVRERILGRCGIKAESTAAETLKNFKNVPLIKSLLRYRELEKLTGTYTDVLREKSGGQSTYRLHADFNQLVTNTGRLSSSRPNLQNIPTRTKDGSLMREVFIAKPGHIFIDADYSQIEPRVMAHMSGDKALIKIFTDGLDLYDTISAYVGCTRDIAKILWLALAYNAGAFRISQIAKISVLQAQEFLSKMRNLFPEFFYWRELTIRKTEQNHTVRTLYGRDIPIGPEDSGKGPNYIIQGSAAEIMKQALIRTRLYGQVITVHDEILYEVPWEYWQGKARTLKQLLESDMPVSVPIKVDIGTGQTWGEAKKKSNKLPEGFFK